MQNHQISLPAGYAPVLVQEAGIVPPSPLEGQASSSVALGPFAPVAGKPVLIQLSGTWQGSLQVQRSIDSGATRHNLTLAGQPWGRFTMNACEPVWEEEEPGAELYIQITLTSGTVDYRLSQ